MFKKFSFLVAVCCFMMSFAQAQETDPNMEHAHFGIQMDMMPGGPLGGSMMVSGTVQSKDYFGTLGAGAYVNNDKVNGDTKAFQLETRLGVRHEIADYTWLDFGWDYSTNAGSAPGQHPAHDMSTGPLIGLTRHFPHFLITAFVMPIQYQQNNDTGNHGHGFSMFENGGIGFVYLFN